MVRNDWPITHDTFCRKQDVKAVSSKVQVLPLLRHRHDAALGYYGTSSCGHRPRLTLLVLIWPSEHFEFETLGLSLYQGSETRGLHMTRDAF